MMSGQWGLLTGKVAGIKLSFQLGLMLMIVSIGMIVAVYLGSAGLAAGVILLAALIGALFVAAIRHTLGGEPFEVLAAANHIAAGEFNHVNKADS